LLLVNYITALNLSEDIKLSIITALNLLVEKADIVVLNQLYSEVDCKHVGYLIYICTTVIKNEKMNILRFVGFILHKLKTLDHIQWMESYHITPIE